MLLALAQKVAVSVPLAQALTLGVSEEKRDAVIDAEAQGEPLGDPELLGVEQVLGDAEAETDALPELKPLEEGESDEVSKAVLLTLPQGLADTEAHGENESEAVSEAELLMLSQGLADAEARGEGLADALTDGVKKPLKVADVVLLALAQ